ncbi:hypothetical protein BSKO_09766 [Bryopsis sp. KO-2023]|nr:hypothetical protein BSKO_09766 [Bryopsis sp. KO-2023]
MVFDFLKREVRDVRMILDVLTCWVVLIFNFGALGKIVKPYARHFSETDASLALPHTGTEIVDDWRLITVILLAPLLVFFAFQCRRRSFIDVKVAFLSVSQGITVASMFARYMKLSGRLRPDFLERLATGNEHLVLDGRTSFPSEHTTYAFSSMVAVFWYLVGKLHVFESRYTSFPVALVVLTPLGVAAGIGVSRTLDHLHHFSDIVAGACIGSFSGSFAYFLNFPSPFHCECHLSKREIDPESSKKKR